MENQHENRLGLIEGLLRNCAVAVFALDTHHRVIYWNMACEQLTGIAADEIMGTDRHWMAFYDHKRPCLSDLLLDGELEEGFEHYNVFGKSTLLPDGVHAAGWYPGLGGQKRYIIFDAAPVYDTDGELVAAVETLQDITRRKRLEEEKDLLVTQLREALASIKQLQGLLPICSTCKKIRDDKGYWNKLECYIEAHSAAEFTHSMCPECEAKFYKACEKAVLDPFQNGV
jgi:transcriptional regulator with PAS, ATPase and Fis domain